MNLPSTKRWDGQRIRRSLEFNSSPTAIDPKLDRELEMIAERAKRRCDGSLYALPAPPRQRGIQAVWLQFFNWISRLFNWISRRWNSMKGEQ